MLRMALRNTRQVQGLVPYEIGDANLASESPRIFPLDTPFISLPVRAAEAKHPQWCDANF